MNKTMKQLMAGFADHRRVEHDCGASPGLQTPPKMSFSSSPVSVPARAAISAASRAPTSTVPIWRKPRAAASKTWHAYLSTTAEGGKPGVNARDRIGKGPWVNAKGVQIASSVR